MRFTPTLDLTDDDLVIPDLEVWIERYLNDCRLQLHKEVTVIHYSNALKRFAIWHKTELPEGRIYRQNAQEFAYWLTFVKYRFDDHPGKPTAEDHLSPATVRRTIGVVRTFFRWLFEKKYLPQNLVEWFRLPKKIKLPKKMIEPSTLAALFDGAATGEMPVRDTAVIALLADTGLRRKEITTIRVTQIIFLDEQGTGYLHNVRGKHDSLRDVPFSPIVGLLLQHWLKERETISESTSTATTLFIQESGQVLQPLSIYQLLRRCALRSGVIDEVWNTHSMRHNFATHFWRIQRDTKSLSMILGHSSQKVTEDIYVHPDPADLIQSHTSVLRTGDVTLPNVQRSVPRPTKFLLRLAIQEKPSWRELGRQFQMSDSGVRKMARKYDLLDTYYAARKQFRELPMSA